MDVADCDGERVRSVGRLGCLVKLEKAGDHELHLLLGRKAVAYDGALDGEWSIFDDRETAACGGEHGHAADLAELESRLCIGGEEDFFDCNDCGLVKRDEGEEFGVDLRETLRGLVFLVETDGAGGEVDEARRTGGWVHLNDTVAGELRSAIDTEDSHRRSLLHGWAAACWQERVSGVRGGQREIPSSGELAVA